MLLTTFGLGKGGRMSCGRTWRRCFFTRGHKYKSRQRWNLNTLGALSYFSRGACRYQKPFDNKFWIRRNLKIESRKYGCSMEKKRLFVLDVRHWKACVWHDYHARSFPAHPRLWFDTQTEGCKSPHGLASSVFGQAGMYDLKTKFSISRLMKAQHDAGRHRSSPRVDLWEASSASQIIFCSTVFL